MSGEAEIRKKKIYRVTFIGFAVNLLLAGIKLAAGSNSRRVFWAEAVPWSPTPYTRSPTWRPTW